jgi:ribosomal protein L7/L12
VATVKIIGWRPGFEKVSHTKVLQELCNLSLSDAKNMTDRVLAGRVVEVEVPTNIDVIALVNRLNELGANAKTAEDK